jgi:ABC-type transporter Mla MlaB component
MGAKQAATVALAVRGPLERSDLPGLYERVCRLLEDSGAAAAVCDVAGLAADAVAADALARLALAGRRRGCQVSLRGSSERLRELLAFMGLAEVLPEVAAATSPAAAGGRRSGADAGARGRT